MAVMYIPRQRSPWEQMLPQILGQMALMKVQQNFQAKQQEMELAGKVSLAGGKELTTKEIETPTQEGYRRFKYGEKTYRVPMSVEERLGARNIFKAGDDLYQFKDGGVVKITDSSEYQPKLFVDKEGNYKWVEPGKSVPKGFKKWTATSAKGVTPPTRQRLFEYYQKLPSDKQKDFKKFLAITGLDPLKVLMAEGLFGDSDDTEMETMGRQPGETAEEYLERIGE